MSLNTHNSPARRVLASILCGSLAAAPAVPAAAAGRSGAAPAADGARPAIAVVSFALDDSARAAERLAWLSEQAIRRHKRQELKPLATLLDPEGTAARAKKADEGQAEYDSARQQYEELEVQKAAEHCDKSLAAFERADLSEGFDRLVRTWMFRIASLVANADNRTAGIELNILLPLDTQTPFDASVFAPDFIAQVKQRRAEIESKSTLSLDVQTKPAPARVYVNGSFRGISPIDVKSLPPGDHYLTLVAPGYQFVQKRVRPGVGQTLVEVLEPTAKHARYAGFVDKMKWDVRGPGRGVVAREMAHEYGLNEVLMLSVVARGKDQLQVLGVRIDARDGHELGYVDEALPNDEVKFGTAAEGLVDRLVATDLPRKNGKPVTRTGGGFTWTARHTGYTLVGAGLAALGAGIYFGLDAKDVESQFKAAKAVQTDPVYKQLESDGRRSALVADLSYLGAIILGGTGLFLAITGRAGEWNEEANPYLTEHRTVTGPGRDEAAGGSRPSREPARTAPRAPEPVNELDGVPPPRKAEPAPAPVPAAKPAAPAPKVEPKAEPKKSEPAKPAAKPGSTKGKRFDDAYLDDLRDD